MVYQKPAFDRGPPLHAVTAQACVSPFLANCFDDPPPPPPPPHPPPPLEEAPGE
jgi:hypothetical protein